MYLLFFILTFYSHSIAMSSILMHKNTKKLKKFINNAYSKTKNNHYI